MFCPSWAERQLWPGFSSQYNIMEAPRPVSGSGFVWKLFVIKTVEPRQHICVKGPAVAFYLFIFLFKVGLLTQDPGVLIGLWWGVYLQISLAMCVTKNRTSTKKARGVSPLQSYIIP